MDLSLNPSQVRSVRLVDGKREALVVQFSKDAFGHIQVEAWGPGHPRLFTISVPASGAPELERLESTLA
jgi:hypothetical protein